MELKRKCEQKIRMWYQNGRKALLVKGARQVGKTHLIRSVLTDMGCDYLEINLIETPEAIDVLRQVTSVDDLIFGLSTISGKKLEKWEESYYKKNKHKINFQKPKTQEDTAAQEYFNKWLGGGNT